MFDVVLEWSHERKLTKVWWRYIGKFNSSKLCDNELLRKAFKAELFHKKVQEIKFPWKIILLSKLSKIYRAFNYSELLRTTESSQMYKKLLSFWNLFRSSKVKQVFWYKTKTMKFQLALWFSLKFRAFQVCWGF